MKETDGFQRYLHHLICFCSSYAGLRKASLKNHTVFTIHTRGKNAKPTEKITQSSFNGLRNDFSASNGRPLVISTAYRSDDSTLTSKVPFAEIQLTVIWCSCQIHCILIIITISVEIQWNKLEKLQISRLAYPPTHLLQKNASKQINCFYKTECRARINKRKH